MTTIKAFINFVSVGRGIAEAVEITIPDDELSKITGREQPGLIDENKESFPINKLIHQIVQNDAFSAVYAKLEVSPPVTCEYCPFGYKTREPASEISNDPSEAHYICGLLKKDVWGEEPKCESELTEMLKDYLVLFEKWNKKGIDLLVKEGTGALDKLMYCGEDSD